MYKAADNRYECGMPLRRCGNSGVMLPEISLGYWHNFGGVNSFENSLAMTLYAFDHGVMHFDLANNYGPPYGSAEETFGRIMKKALSPYRDELFISSKAGYDMWPGPYGNWGSRKYLMSSLDQSLRRMGLDYVDLFYSHRYDPETPLEETLQALVDIVRQGKALYIGISRWPLQATEFAIRYLRERDVPMLIYQGRYNIFDREPQQQGILDLLYRNKIGFISFSPLAQGLLTNRYINGIPDGSRMSRNHSLKDTVLTQEMLLAIRQLNAIAESQGCTLAELALRWILSDERITSVIIGSSSVTQLADNIAAVQFPPLQPAILSQIESSCAHMHL